MRILHLAAGAGSMYCGACTRDVTLIRGMIARGHDVRVVPLYTPLRLEEGPALPMAPLFVGGINAYLQQSSALFRHTPDWLDRLLDSPGLLRWASRFAVTVNPADLGPMTVSMLDGRHGRQRKELDRMFRYLEAAPRPEVVSITNSLLSGIAPEIRARLGTPIVCALQGEDAFVEAMPEPYRSRAWERIRHNAESVDLFVATSESHAETMAAHLAVPVSQVRVIRAGIDASPYGGERGQPDTRFTIGYLGVIHRPKGLDLLMDAFRALVVERRLDIRLLVAGRVLDKRYWHGIQQAARLAGIEGRVHYYGEVSFIGKAAIFHQCDVFVAPSRVAEARGMVVLEAMASRVPAVAPAAGVFPEMIALTGGGLLFESGDARSLEAVLARLVQAPAEAQELGRNAVEGVSAHYAASEMVDRTLDSYTSVATGATAVAGRPAGAQPMGPRG